jgi:phage repressor protein C with HTH and peptisase S24 domain
MYASELARKLEMLPNSYRSIENGHKPLKFTLAVKIAKILAVPIAGLVDAKELEDAGGLEAVEGLLGESESAERVRAGARDLPIYGRSQLLITDVEMVETGSFLERPSVVAQAKGAYALRVFDDRAAPRYDVGDILIVDPDHAPTPNQWCVVTIIKGEKLVAEIHRVVQIDKPGRRIVLAEARPDGEDYIGLAVIKSVDVIVGTQLA